MTQTSQSTRPPPETQSNGHAESNGSASLSDRVRSLRLHAGGATARPRGAWLPWGLTVIALGLAALFGWRAYRITPVEADAAPQATTSGDVVKQPTESGSATAGAEVVLDSKGYVIASHQIKLSPQVGGEIIWLDPNFKEGAIYKKGERLAEVDPVIYRAQVKSAKAALHVAETNFKQVDSGSTLREVEAARAQLKNMIYRLELSRIDERNKRLAGNATSRDDMEKASVQIMVDEAAHESQKQTLDKLEVSLEEQRLVARAQVQSAEANLEQAQKQLANCTIVAPTTGIILTKNAEKGGYVNPLAYSGVAGYLCEMADLRDLEVELDIQERDIKFVKPGQRCLIMPEACQKDDTFRKTHGKDGYTGRVSRLMPVANRSKGAITVRVTIDFPEKEESGAYLRPDMGALVSFLK